MASLPGDFLSEDQFLCSICLEVFTVPVSTPCGHSFCLACISYYWDGTGGGGRQKAWLCPLCKESFRRRPELHVNHTLRDITEQFKRMAESAEAEPEAEAEAGAGPATEQRPSPRRGGLPGGLLLEMKSRFQRSASNALPSPPPYEAHSPQAAPGMLRRSTVSGASGGGGADAPLCPRHWQGLELFCRADQTCVCQGCMEEEHQGHEAVPAEREWLIKKSRLDVMDVDLQDQISERERKVEEIKASLAEIQASAECEVQGTMRVFSALIGCVERCQAVLLEVVERGRRSAEVKGQALIVDLEKEISALRKRSNVLTQLAQSNDHIHFLRTFPLLCSTPQVKEWADVSVTPDPTVGAVLRNVTQMMERFQEELFRLPEICLRPPAEPSPAKHQPKVRRVQQYAVDVTLDLGTAHPRLVISEDGKQVHCSDRYHVVPDTPERFDRVVCVLGRQGFSSGRHYWEVQVGGKTDWDLGVASRSVDRKGKITVSPAHGYWFLSLRERHEYAFRTEPSTPLGLAARPKRVGVYVDYKRGQVSFYNVEAKQLIYTFKDSFSDTIHPFFSPCTNRSGQNEAPLVICPVSLT